MRSTTDSRWWPKGFASGRRAEIIDVLVQGERSVEDLAAAIGQSTANTSQHLRQLANAGLVRSRRDGSRIIYSLTSPEVGLAWATLRALAVDHVADMKRLVADYLGDRDGLETIGRGELAKRLRRDDVIVLDVRPEAEFRAGHIEGARPVPPGELERRLAELPNDREIVAYCRGRTAFTPMKQSARSPPAAGVRGGSKTASPSGHRPACRWHLTP